MKSNDLKAIKMKLVDLDNERKILSLKSSQISKSINEITNKYNSLNKQLEKLSKDFIVSEHALLRYIEKTYNIDLNKLCSEILASKSLSKYDLLGDAEYPTDEGLKMVIRDKVVVTIK